MSNPLLDSWTPNWYSEATEEDQAGFREWFCGVLRTERVNVCFTKTDGTERWLHCTLHPELVPVSESTDAAPRKINTAAQLSLIHISEPTRPY